MNKKIRRNKFFIVVVTVASLVFALNLLKVFLTTPINSDFVAIQAMFHGVPLFADGAKWFGLSTFILKLPLYAVLDGFHLSAGVLMATTSLVLNFAGLTMFIISVRYFFRKWGVPQWAYLSLLWFAALGSAFFLYLYNPNSRNIEIGFCFLVLMVASQYVDREINFKRKWMKLYATGLVLIAALVFYSDPYFLYMIGGPLLLYLGYSIYQRGPSKRLLWLGTAVIASIVAYILIKSGLGKLGYEFYPFETRFNPHAWTAKVDIVINDLLEIFNANFAGRNVFTPGSMQRAVNAGFLGLTILLVAVYAKKLLASYKYVGLFLVLAAWSIAMLFISDKTTSHYLILLPFITVLLVGVLIAHLRTANPKLLVVYGLVFVTATVVNTAAIARDIVPDYRSYKAAQFAKPNLALIDTLQQNGLTKGYAEYWDASVNTYYSDYQNRITQVICTSDSIHVYTWFATQYIYDRPADKTFFVLNSDDPYQQKTCSTELVNQTFGQPVQTLESFPYTIFVYDHDIRKDFR